MALADDVNELETAMRLFFQTMKRPQRWSGITQRAGVAIDRPAAAILHILALPQEQGCRVQDLAAHLGIEAPSVTRKTQELEQAGYIRRSRNPDDRRAIGLVITPRGKRISQRLHEAQSQLISQVLEQWPAADRRRFVELFQRFSDELANQQFYTKQSR